jgi:hypothetical protein
MDSVKNLCLYSILDGLGVATGQLPRPRFAADFRGGYGFLRLAGIPVCSFSDGNFHSSNRRPNLVALEEDLIHHRLDPAIRSDLFKIASSIVNHAADRAFGCTLVLDLVDFFLDFRYGRRYETGGKHQEAEGMVETGCI